MKENPITKKGDTQDEATVEDFSQDQKQTANQKKAKNKTNARDARAKTIEELQMPIKRVDTGPSKSTSRVVPIRRHLSRPASAIEVSQIGSIQSNSSFGRLALSGTKIRKTLVASATPHAVEEAKRAAGENATRRALMKVMAGDELSSSEAIEAVRSLRASLVQTHSKIEPPGKSIGQEIKAYDSLKAGMQDISVRRLVTSKGIEMPSAKPRSRLSGKIIKSAPRRATKIQTGPIKGPGVSLKTVAADDLVLFPVEKSQEAVPTLSYGLERVLFNPGVYHLQDPRSRVFNFDPYLQDIMPVNEFDFNALKEYITSSRDESLLGIAREQGKKYTGSTSSMTAALAHFHFLLSQWRPVNTEMLSQNFPVEFNSFTALQRGPSAVFLRYKDGVYAIDADKQYDTSNILSMLGKSMEKLLTLPKEGFEKYRKVNSDQISVEERNEAETFHYTTIGDFLLRSQLDAYDSRLPGTGMFDLKTRAVVSIRMDTKKYEEGRGYEIRSRQGEWESYEREYYDMIRAAFLKYSLQVRMGRMDGIFVAFHNTERIFGFQYISLPEMDLALHGTENTTIGDAEFKLSLELLNQVLDKATAKFPEKSLRLHFETREGATPFTYIFAEPMKEEQINAVQKSNQEEILKFEREVLGLDQKTDEELLKEKKDAEWEVLRAKVEASMEKDELDIQEAKEIAESVLEDSEFWDELSPDEKYSAINELVNSAAFNEAEAKAESESIPIDDAEDYVDEEEDAGSLAEEEDEDANEDSEDALGDGEAESEQELEEPESDVIIHDEMAEEGSERMLDETMPKKLDQGFSIEDKNEGRELETSLEMVHAAKANSEGDDGSVEKEMADIAEVNLEQATIADTYETLVTESCPKQPEDTPEEVANKDSVFESLLSESDSETLRKDESEASSSQETEPVSDVLVDKVVSPTAESAHKAPSAESLQDAAPAASLDIGKEAAKPSPVFAMTLTIRNIVNGQYVERPKELTEDDKWTIEYALVDSIPEERAQNLYVACKKRRSQSLSFEKKDENNFFNAYLNNLKKISKRGRDWRASQNEIDSAFPPKRLDLKDGKKVELKDEWRTSRIQQKKRKSEVHLYDS